MRSTDTDRPRGILSRTDRAWLLGETAYESRQSTHERRRRIRERVRNALFDYPILLDELTERDRDAALDRDRFDRGQLLDATVAQLALAYEIAESKGWDFDRVLEDAVNEAHRGTGRSPTPARVTVADNVVIAQDHYHWFPILQRAGAKWDSGRVTALTDVELRVLIEFGDIEAPRILEAYRSQRREELKERASDERLEEYEQRLRMLGDADDDPDEEGS